MTLLDELHSIKQTGNKFYNDKDYYLALSEYSSIISKLEHFLKPNASIPPEYKDILVQAFGNRCSAYLQLNQFDEATADALNCCKLEPKSPKFLLKLATCHQRKRKFSDAIAVYRQVIIIDPHNSEARTNLQKLQAQNIFTSSSSSSSESSGPKFDLSDFLSRRISEAFAFFTTHKDTIIVVLIACFLYYYFYLRTPSYESHSSYSNSYYGSYSPGVGTTGWILILVCAYFLPPRMGEILPPQLARPFFGFSMINFIWLVDFLLKLRGGGNQRRRYY